MGHEFLQSSYALTPSQRAGLLGELFRCAHETIAAFMSAPPFEKIACVVELSRVFIARVLGELSSPDSVQPSIESRICLKGIEELKRLVPVG